MDLVGQLQQIIDHSKRIVFFGGAGVSTESGIPDFRSVNGLYHQHYEESPETILSHTYFETHPEEFFRFYRDKMLYLSAKPNPAHEKLAEMEAKGILTAIITQNVDGLHQMAGSKNVLELHGSIHRNYCRTCHQSYPVAAIQQSEDVPKCDCGGIIKPDVVLYEEPLDQNTVKAAYDLIQKADTLLIAGTSLTVYPAAGMIQYFEGNKIVLINRDVTPMDVLADLVIHSKVGEVLQQIKLA